MSCDNQISTQDLINAKTDAVTLGEVATSRVGAESSGAPITTSTNRFNETTDTLQGRLNKIGIIFDDPIRDWSASLLVSDLRAHRYPAATGEIYIPVKPLPFTTGGTFNTNDWELFQGLTEQQLIADLSQAYEFDAWQSMKNSLIAFPVGKVLRTKVHTGFDVGGASYVVAAGASPDTIGSPDLAGGGYAKIQNKHSIANAASYGCLPDDGATDSSAAFSAAISTGLSVFLPKVNDSYYKILNAQLLDNQTLFSYGAKIGGFGNSTCINHGEESVIQGVKFVGGGRNGADTNQKAVRITTKYYTKTLFCDFVDISGSAIFAYQIVDIHQGGLIQGNNIQQCNEGITMFERAEYFRLPDNVIAECNVGTAITGGNTNMNGTVISDCDVAIYLRTGSNDAHGVVSGCSMNHCTYAIRTEALITNTFNFTGCEIHASNIWLQDVTGITIENCEMSSVQFIEENTRQCYVKNNHFVNNVTVTPNFNGTESEVFYLDNIYGRAVTPINPASPEGLNGGYSHVKQVGSVTNIATGTTEQTFDTVVSNAITSNLNYTVQTFYGNSGGGGGNIIRGDVSYIRLGATLDVQAYLNVGTATLIAWTSDQVKIRIVEFATGDTIGYFTPVTFNSETVNHLINYTYVGKIPRTAIQIKVENNTGALINMYSDQAGTDTRAFMKVTGW